jgi:hypothetical protein
MSLLETSQNHSGFMTQTSDSFTQFKGAICQRMGVGDCQFATAFTASELSRICWSSDIMTSDTISDDIAKFVASLESFLSWRWSFATLLRSYRAALWGQHHFRPIFTPTPYDWPGKLAYLTALKNSIYAAMRS